MKGATGSGKSVVIYMCVCVCMCGIGACSIPKTNQMMQCNNIP